MIRLNDNGTTRILVKQMLQAKDLLMYEQGRAVQATEDARSFLKRILEKYAARRLELAAYASRGDEPAPMEPSAT